MTRVLLDTEIGNNIDDAFAVALAATSPEIELLGVCTVGDDTPARSILARRLLGEYGRVEVPVATGLKPSHPLPSTPTRFTQRQYAKSGGKMSPSANQSVVEFMADMITRYSRVTLVATGPLTNIAATLRAYPSVERSVERLVFMGGWPSQGLPESNIGQDAGAANTVLSSRIPVVLVGYEVTRACALRHRHLQHLECSSGSGPRFLHALWRAWERACHVRHAIMHDPLTIAFLCKPELMEFRNMRVQVRPQTDISRGLICSGGSGGREVTVATDVLAEAYLNLLMDRVAPVQTPPWRSYLHHDPLRWGVVLKQVHRARHFAGWTSGPQYVTDHVLAVLLQGGCTVTAGNDSFRAERGSVLYFNSDQTYCIQSDEGMDAFWFHFTVYQQEIRNHHVRIQALPELSPHSIISEQQLQMLILQAERLEQHWKNPGPDSGFACQAAMLEMLGTLFAIRSEQTAASRSDGEIAVIQAKRFIETHFDRDLSLAQVAKHVSLSPYYLAKLFKRYTGLTPFEYQLQLRMDHAKSLLRTHAIPIKAVASQVGYASAQSFSRAFKRETGMSPHEARDWYS